MFACRRPASVASASHWVHMEAVTVTRFIAEFGTGQVFLSMLWFFMFFIWIWLMIAIFTDIFRSHDMSGLTKALWLVLVIVLPYLGVFVYLIARGGKMQEHAAQQAQAQEAAKRQYIQGVTAAASPADEIARLADLKDKGHITDAEFQAGKAKALAGG
jgi:hypothetical protein